LGGTLPGVLAVYIRYSTKQEDALRDLSVDIKAKIEWIKQTAGFWSTVAVGLSIGFLGFTVAWHKLITDGAERLAAVQTQPQGAAMAQMAIIHDAEIKMTIIICYTICCPIYEVLRRTWDTNRLLLDIKQLAREK
jgi:hypothetical protein